MLKLTRYSVPSLAARRRQIDALNALPSKRPIHWAVLFVLVSEANESVWEEIHTLYSSVDLLAARVTYYWMTGESRLSPARFLDVPMPSDQVVWPWSWSTVLLCAFVFVMGSAFLYIKHWMT